MQWQRDEQGKFLRGTRQTRAALNDGIFAAFRWACLVLTFLCALKELFEYFFDCVGTPPCTAFDWKTCVLALVLFCIWGHPYVFERISIVTKPPNVRKQGKASWTAIGFND
jgi:hypothetical protein